MVWPGDSTTKPRGWVLLNNGQPLRIGVPNKPSFNEFVASGKGPDNVTGYCIDIFNAAVKPLLYPVPSKFILTGDGTHNPKYDDIISMVANNPIDVAVGDFAIVKNRTRIAEFTQPYIESGMVIVAPVKQSTSSAWAFFKPFTFEMWCVTGALFVFVGIVVWILKHRTNEEFRGTPQQQVLTIFLFAFSTMFFAHGKSALHDAMRRQEQELPGDSGTTSTLCTSLAAIPATTGAGTPADSDECYLAWRGHTSSLDEFTIFGQS